MNRNSSDYLELFQPTTITLDFKSRPGVYGQGEGSVLNEILPKVMAYALLLIVALPIGVVLSFILPSAEDNKVLGVVYMLVTLGLAVAPYLWLGKKLDKFFDERASAQKDVEEERFNVALEATGFSWVKGNVFSLYRNRFGSVMSPEGVVYNVTHVEENPDRTVTLYLNA